MRSADISGIGTIWWGERPREPRKPLVLAAREDARPTSLFEIEPSSYFNCHFRSVSLKLFQ
jgi:hypothetical protein